MELREFKKLQIKASLLGFGCMRFPIIDNDDSKIDKEAAEAMLDYAYQNGVNYFDTANPYHQGNSEIFVGETMKKYDRSSYYLATKLPMWKVDSLDSAKVIFNNQLEKLQTNYIDFYLFHALNKNTWKKILDFKLLDYAKQLQEEGKIRYIGFSFHDDLDTFVDILNGYDWDFCQIQLNYMDTDHQQGITGYELAVKKEIPVIIMEPIKGGSLAVLPDDISKIFKEEDPEASIASWAMRYIASLDNVKVVLSGMSTMDQLKDNIKTFTNFKSLSIKEEKVVDEVSKAIKARQKSICTGCRYCMPCPHGVNIPRCFSIWNNYSMYGNKNSANYAYYKDLKEEARAHNCQECGFCESQCPQQIEIIKDLKLVAKTMEEIRK